MPDVQEARKSKASASQKRGLIASSLFIGGGLSASSQAAQAALRRRAQQFSAPTTLMQGFLDQNEESDSDVEVVQPKGARATSSVSATPGLSASPPSRPKERRQLRDASPSSGTRRDKAVHPREGKSRTASPKASSSKVTLEDSLNDDDEGELEEVDVTQQDFPEKPISAPSRRVPQVKIEVLSDEDDDDDVVEVAPPPGAQHSRVLPPPKQLPEVFSLPRSTADPEERDGGGFVKEEEDSGQLGAPTSVMQTMGRLGKQAVKQRKAANGGIDPLDEEEDARYRARLERQDSAGPSNPARLNRSSTPYTRDEPWPQHFIKLEKTFKAVNLVHSFCSARKHMAPTFDVIKSGAESLLKRSVEMSDLAQIKSLCPELINFAYVDTELLDVHFEGASAVHGGARPLNGTEGDGLTYRQRIEAGRKGQGKNMDEVYAETARRIEAAPSIPVDIAGLPASGSGWQADIEPSEHGTYSAPLLPPVEIEALTQAQRKEKRRDDGHVLIFEFNDGTTNGPKATTKGRFQARGPPTRGYKSKPRPPLNSLPSTQSMQRLINKRNAKFEQAVLELLAACKAKEEDPVQLLIDAAQSHYPVDPEVDALQRENAETPKKKRRRLKYLMENPDDRDPISEIIEELKAQPDYKEQIVPGGRKSIPARDARYGELNYQLSQELVDALWHTRGIEKFFTHQAEALNAFHEGKSVIVSTSTSSGKSLIYQIPTLQAMESDMDATAFFIFPTKALAQDQKRSLQDLLMNYAGLEETVVATYDGDTQKELRRDIRNRASVIFTNPDMLHQAILPSEEAWRRFLRNLRIVVVDELHTYNGVFGAHVSFIMRRLRRVCTALGNRKVQFISCSATVANPKEHMQTLFGIDEVQVVTNDGSPTGSKEWVIWNPPYIDPADPAQGRVSAYSEVSKIFIHLIERGVRTILFTKVRRTCEIVIRQVRNDLLLQDRVDIIDKVMSYRSGYSPQERRKIEQDMFKGSLLGIVATSALELGIDIGSLDAVIMLGFPYSISSLRQQAGRAGRRQKDSLSVLVGEPWPLDQQYMRQPESIFTEADAALSVDLDNDFILEAHLQCAALEMPIHPADDEVYFGPQLETLCKTRLSNEGNEFYHCRDDLGPNPSRDVAIRGARQISYAYIDDTPGRDGGPKVLEEVELDRAIFEAYEGAVFMHQGLSYICREVDHVKRIARMYQADVNYHTRPRDHTDTDAVETYRIRTLAGTPVLAYFGKVTISSHVWGYFKVDRRANILDAVDVDCPPYVRHTKGMWLDVPGWLVNALTEKTINAAAAIHAAEHALLSLTPMFIITAAGDVQTECKIAEREYGKKPTTRRRPARLIFYDTPGQNGGVCAKAFAYLDSLLRIAIAVIEACPCLDGCLSCVVSQHCRHANLVSSKVGALGVLRGLAGREPFDPDLPQQNEPGHGTGMVEGDSALHHTIREASPVRALDNVEVEHIEEVIPPSLQALEQAAARDRTVPGTARARPGLSTTFIEDTGTPEPDARVQDSVV